MDGIAGVQARISELHNRLGSLMPHTPPAPRAGAPSFAQTLASASSAPGAPALTTGAGSAQVGARWGAALRPAGLSGVPPLVAGAAGHAHPAAPAGLAQFGNGTIPAGELVTLAGSRHRLWAPAASGFERLRAAAQADGVTVRITDSYRSYEGQVDVAARKGLYSQGGLAATPGTSNHGWGLSVDLDLNPAAQAWMRANAGRFGFAEDVAREPWHWTYQNPA